MPYMRAIYRWLCALFLLLATNAGTFAAPITVLIVPSREGGAYREVAQTIESGLDERQRAGITFQVTPLPEFRDRDSSARPALIVTIGVDAAREVARLNPPAPILHTLVPRETARDLLRGGQTGHRDSAVFLDQPIGRQIDLLRLALPKHKRVAVILGPSTTRLLPELRAAARERSLTIHDATIKTRDQLLPTLEHLLDDNDILLSVAEPLAYHSETIHHVLLTTYRYKIPVMGLSKAYVDAGALLAVYSTPEHIGRQVAQLLAGLSVGRTPTLPEPSHPKYYTVSVNKRVAASLDLSIEDEDTLLRKLEALSRPQLR